MEQVGWTKKTKLSLIQPLQLSLVQDHMAVSSSGILSRGLFRE